jgi:hypothetical protein
MERRGGGILSERARHVIGGGGERSGRDALAKRVEVSEGCGEGEGRELAEERGGESRDPVDESTGEGPHECGEGGGAKSTMPVCDKTSVGKGLEGKECHRRGEGNRRRRHSKRPQICKRGKFRARQKRQGRGRRVKETA